MVIFDRMTCDMERPVVNKIMSNAISGAVINDVLSEIECEEILKLVPILRERFFTDLNAQNGYSLPSMFGQLHKSLSYDLAIKYFNEIESFISTVNTAYNGNLSHKISHLLTRAFWPFNVTYLNKFLPYSFRIVYPAGQGLSLHRDKDLLPYIHENVSIQISDQIQPELLMSWFFTLQQPEKGGELWVGDDSYNQYPKEHEMLIALDGKKILPASMEHIEISTKKGSLLLFRGGNYWHKVLPPGINSKERITLGGFMAPSIDGRNIFVWS